MKFLSHQISLRRGCKWQLPVEITRNNQPVRRFDAACGLALAAGVLLGAVALTSAASLADDAPARKCSVAITVDRVFRSGATQAPAALVTLRHECGITAQLISIACTWLAGDKPVAVAETLYQNVRPKVPATRKLIALDADGMAFDAARCRLTGSQP